MTEFSQVFKIQFLEPLCSDSSMIHSIILTANQNLRFSEKTKTSAPGTLYDQSMKVTVDRNSNEALGNCGPQRHVIVKISDDNNKYSWGSSDIPVTMTVTPSINVYILEFSCQSTTPLIPK